MRSLLRWLIVMASLCVVPLLYSSPVALAQGPSDDTVLITPQDEADEALLALMAKPAAGDLDAILARGFLRVGTVYGPLFFTSDGPKTSGLTVELMAELEKHLRAKLGARAKSLTLVVVPLPRDKLIAALRAGHVDMIAANLTVTQERSALIDFTNPLARGVQEILVTMASGPQVQNLAAMPIHVRRSSSYAEHLRRIDALRQAEGRPGLSIVEVDESLEDEDLLELVSVGVIPATVVDDHKLRLFTRIFDNLVSHPELVVNAGGTIAWGVRKKSPQLLDALNSFVRIARKGTALGNTLGRRYYADVDRIRNALEGEAGSRFGTTIDFIRTYADHYDFDALMIAAQGFQESRLDQKARSPMGAIGIMQLMPATANDPAIGIPDIHVAERNVEAGVKYLRLLRDRYLNDPAISRRDQVLMAFAAYNAGPGNLRKARRRAKAMGLDPNRWFGHVEMGMARAVSREPVVYVRNILKYYVTYRLAVDARQPGSPHK